MIICSASKTLYHAHCHLFNPVIVSVAVYLSVQGVLGGQFILQFIIEVVNVCGLPLSSQVAFL